jgi:hypothetical protein
MMEKSGAGHGWRCELKSLQRQRDEGGIEMTDHCHNCTVRGDLEACRTVCGRATSNPCDVPTAWGAAARIAELEAENARLRASILEAYGEVGAAAMQSLDSDDQIIMGHVRDAARILRSALAGRKE